MGNLTVNMLPGVRLGVHEQDAAVARLDDGADEGQPLPCALSDALGLKIGSKIFSSTRRRGYRFGAADRDGHVPTVHGRGHGDRAPLPGLLDGLGRVDDQLRNA
jgi:hypothetical protein